MLVSDSRILHDGVIIVALIVEFFIVVEYLDIEIAQIFHLLISISNALIWNRISFVPHVLMNIVAWYKQHFDALVLSRGRFSPYSEVNIIPIEAIKAAIRILRYSIVLNFRVARHRIEFSKLFFGTFVIVNDFLIGESFILAKQANNPLHIARVVYHF